MDFHFPDIELALQQPNGLLAVGGNLTSNTLKEAYKNGIFPWFSSGEEIMWWSPDPRAVISLDTLHLSHKLKKFMRKYNFKITINKAFNDVINNCARKYKKPNEIWITDSMLNSYQLLNKEGFAHSFEIWDNNILIGGLYGVALGQIFSGESMFFKKEHASKIALLYSCAQIYEMGFKLLDCQIMNNHLSSMGAINIPRSEFKKLLIYKNEEIKNIRPIKMESYWSDTRDLYGYYVSKKIKNSSSI